MASKYWIKLYHEILDDPKMGRLPDRLWRRVIELFLMAGDCDQDGRLPSVADMAWRLRTSEAELQQELQDIEAAGVITRQNGYIVVTHFSERQDAMTGAERAKRHREAQQAQEYYRDDSVTESVTNSVTDCVTKTYADIDRDIDEKREDKDSLDEKAYAVMLAAWAKSFPQKAQPRQNNRTLSKKAVTRMEDAYFRDNWEKALARAAKSKFLRDEASWFDLGWFLQNADNWEKCLSGKYDDGKKRAGGPPPAEMATALEPGEYVDPDVFFAGGKR